MKVDQKTPVGQGSAGLFFTKEAPVDVEKVRERLVQQYLSDREAMPPSMMNVPEEGASYEEEARAHILTEYTEADLNRLVELYESRAQGKNEDECFAHALEIFHGEKRKLKI